MPYYRRVIRIKAIDSPPIRYALAQVAAGEEPTGKSEDGKPVVDGVLPWQDYCRRRGLDPKTGQETPEAKAAAWDVIRQCIGLDAAWWEGKDVLMFPPEWLNRAERLAVMLRGKPRYAKAIGIDPAEGGDKTAMSAVDEFGLIEQVSKKTPDTAVIVHEAIAFGNKHHVPDNKWIFDSGGGGKQHADRLREMGYRGVRAVAFGETVNLDPKRGMRLLEERIDVKEEHYAYKNRRAEMYGILRLLLDPGMTPQGFALPGEYHQLRHQLSPIPLTFVEGRLELLPKNRRPGEKNTGKKTLVELIGHSPDEADSLVLAIYGMLAKPVRQTAGAL